MTKRHRRRARGPSFLRRKRYHRSRDRRIPLLPTLGIVNYGYNIATAGGKMAKLQSGDLGGYAKWALKDAIMYGTGYDMETNKWSWANLMYGLAPILLGAGVSRIMTMAGVNGYMRRIPLIGKRVKL